MPSRSRDRHDSLLQLRFPSSSQSSVCDLLFFRFLIMWYFVSAFGSSWIGNGTRSWFLWDFAAQLFRLCGFWWWSVCGVEECVGWNPWIGDLGGGVAAVVGGWEFWLLWSIKEWSFWWICFCLGDDLVSYMEYEHLDIPMCLTVDATVYFSFRLVWLLKWLKNAFFTEKIKWIDGLLYDLIHYLELKHIGRNNFLFACHVSYILCCLSLE